MAHPLQHVQLPKPSDPSRSKEDRAPGEALLFFWTNGPMLTQWRPLFTYAVILTKTNV